MEPSEELLSRMALLIEEWRRAPAVLELARVLAEELDAGTEPFVGRPLPEDLVRGRLAAPLASAWVFVLRPGTRNPAHLHPGSTQITAVIQGEGSCTVGDRSRTLAPFDPSAPARTLVVAPPGVPHAFEPGPEPLVVLSFHTVTPEALVEVEVGSQAVRRYVELPDGSR